ncbi:hypothetical protein GCM10023186_09030 [Hymenobacter koreensis]|uniref:Uncharacterized protein n=1 Tax=Hymenobacter koreensis TaxID=1084523 RepID=A0ABP8IVM0_9BACT
MGQTHAQSVGIGTTTPDTKAALDISSTDKGLLVPRLTEAQRTAMGSSGLPAGLMVFQTDGTRPGFWYFFGGQWLALPNQQTAGDNLGNHTATQPLRFSSNESDKILFTPSGLNGSRLRHNFDWSFEYIAGPSSGGFTSGSHIFYTYQAGLGYTERLRVNPNGNVGLGTSSPDLRLEINGSAYVNAENSGFIADEGGQRRVGLMKYAGRQAGIWRAGTRPFEIGRANVSDLAAATASNQFVTDLYVSGDGRVGIGSTAPEQQLDVRGNVAANNAQLRDRAGNGNTLLAVNNDGFVVRPRTFSADAPNGGLLGFQTTRFVWNHNLGRKPLIMAGVEILNFSDDALLLVSYRHIDDNNVSIAVRNMDNNAGARRNFIVKAVIVD